MKQIKKWLIEKGWEISTCNWQINPCKGVTDFRLENYTITKDGKSRSIIIQQFVDETCTLFSNDTDLLWG